MRKRGPASLADLLQEGDEPTPVVAAAAPAPLTRSARSAARRNESKLAVYVGEKAARRIKVLALERDVFVNDLLREGIELMLEKHGQPSLGELER